MQPTSSCRISWPLPCRSVFFTWFHRQQAILMPSKTAAASSTESLPCLPLQEGMNLIQQLAEARRGQPRKVASGTPTAKPAFGLLGYATNSMQSPWEAELQWGKPTPARMSSLSKVSRDFMVGCYVATCLVRSAACLCASWSTDLANHLCSIAYFAK